MTSTTRAPTPDSSGSIVVDGRVRTYLVHTPPRLGDPRALVLNLHGGGGQAAGQVRISGLDRVADAHGFLLVAPQGTSRNWADGRGATEPDRTGVDDVAFLSALIDHVVEQYDIDPGWVFVTGLSNGAFMAQRLACDAAERIAAIAPVAGTLGTAVRCAPTRPVSVLAIHGTADPLVPFTGGVMVGRGGSSTIVSFDEMITRWRTANGCSGTPTTVRLPDNGDGTRVTRTTWTSCRDRTAVSSVVVTNGGHTWPGGLPYMPERVIGATTTQFDASEAIWAFFQEHARRR